MVEIPNELNAGPILPVSGNGVNTVYYQITIFCQRTVPTDIRQTRESLSRTRRELLLHWQVWARTAAQCTYWKFGEYALIR
jgi:hypothetical protein